MKIFEQEDEMRSVIFLIIFIEKEEKNFFFWWKSVFLDFSFI